LIGSTLWFASTFRLIGKNDQVCLTAFDDPKVPGVACHVSQAKTGGLGGTIGVAEDPSRFSIACRPVGPINVDITKLPENEKVYAEEDPNPDIPTNDFHPRPCLDMDRITLEC